MQQTAFGPWTVEFDPDVTRAAYEQLSAPDVGCCSACATFLEVTFHDALPREVVEFLHRVGADPGKPIEVEGAPEAGYLAGWWIFAGRLPGGGWTGEENGALAEPSPGFRCWLTEQVVRGSWPQDGDDPLLQLEFSWESPTLAALERSSRTGQYPHDPV